MTNATQSMKALIFELQDEVFAIDAEGVREILDLVPITEVPNAPEFARGLINVRGRVVPLADLRVTFDMQRSQPDGDTRVVVIEIALGGEPAIVGILADKVCDVADIEVASIEEAPKVGMRWRPEYLRGIGKHSGEFIILPNLNSVFSGAQSRDVPDEVHVL